MKPFSETSGAIAVHQKARHSNRDLYNSCFKPRASAKRSRTGPFCHVASSVFEELHGASSLAIQSFGQRRRHVFDLQRW